MSSYVPDKYVREKQRRKHKTSGTGLVLLVGLLACCCLVVLVAVPIALVNSSPTPTPSPPSQSSCACGNKITFALISSDEIRCNSDELNVYTADLTLFVNHSNVLPTTCESALISFIVTITQPTGDPELITLITDDVRVRCAQAPPQFQCFYDSSVPGMQTLEFSASARNLAANSPYNITIDPASESLNGACEILSSFQTETCFT